MNANTRGVQTPKVGRPVSDSEMRRCGVHKETCDFCSCFLLVFHGWLTSKRGADGG